MDKNPKVSVIIPVYNVEKYLRQCINSVINQTLKDIEIICVDDCSTDNSLSILKEFAKNDSRIKIINLKENGGAGNARNIAIKEVASNYIMFLDSDDYYESNACELAYNQIYENNNDFVVFGAYRYKQEQNEKYIDKKKLEIFSQIQGVKNANISMLNAPYFKYAQSCFKIFKTNFLKENNIEFDKGAFEDQIFNAKILIFAKSFSVLSTPLYVYRIRRNSLSHDIKNWDDYLSSRKTTYEYLKSVNVSENVLLMYIVSAIQLSYSFLKRYTKDNKKLKPLLYKGLHELFLLFDKDCDIKKVEQFIDIDKFNLIKNNSSYIKYLFEKKVLCNIFSIKNSKDKNHKVITILGIKIKIKRR